jgi:pimeloyl-ACP methyl ester carboxylesterase
MATVYSDYERGQYGRNYMQEEDRGYRYSPVYHDERGRQDRAWWDRADDEVRSWLGDEEAGRRRRIDEAALPRVVSPTLLIVGEFDEVVIQLNKETYSQLQCKKELKIVPGATRLFEEPGAIEEVAHLAADWFVKHL